MTRVGSKWMRGAGPLAVLKLLESREMYGYQMAEALEERSEGVVAMGHSTLYPLLYKLESQGLVTVSSERVESGRRRKYYSITPNGRAWLSSHEKEWGRLVRAMRGLGFA